MQSDNKCNREENGKAIALKKQDVTRINPDYYIVKSQTTLRQYNIIKADEKWICSCPDHQFRKVCCKHIHAVEFSIKIREEVKSKTDLTIKPIMVNECLYCHAGNIKKFEVRHNKSGDIQRFICIVCKKTFV